MVNRQRITNDAAANTDLLFSKEEVFGNEGILGMVLMFLDSKQIVSHRRVAKIWNSVGLKVLMDPLHPKQSFSPHRGELYNAVSHYCFGQSICPRVGRFWDSPPLSRAEQFQIKCIYGFTIGKWDTSNVTSMRDIFEGLKEFNEPLEWDTRNVTDMYGMFSCCSSFNQSLRTFNTSKVTNMESMFDYCYAFNQDISNFDTSRVTNMRNMFRECVSFDQSLASFDTSSLRIAGGMLYWTPLGWKIYTHIREEGDCSWKVKEERIRRFFIEEWNWDVSKISGGKYRFSCLLHSPFNY